MRAVLVAGAVIISGLMPAHAKVEKLSEVAWWAAHGGVREDGAFVCAMVTSVTNGSQGQFVIEYVKGTDVFLLRWVKATWSVPRETQKRIALQFGYGPVLTMTAIGSGNELRAAFPLNKLEQFLSGFQRAGSINITFVGGTEPPWSLATGGGGIVETDFLRCVRMSQPVWPQAPTQP